MPNITRSKFTYIQLNCVQKCTRLILLPKKAGQCHSPVKNCSVVISACCCAETANYWLNQDSDRCAAIQANDLPEIICPSISHQLQCTHTSPAFFHFCLSLFYDIWHMPSYSFANWQHLLSIKVAIPGAIVH